MSPAGSRGCPWQAGRQQGRACCAGWARCQHLLLLLLGASPVPALLLHCGRPTPRPALPCPSFALPLKGHYDVQPAMEEGWKYDPFEMHSEDGWLYGRGTTDNKGGPLGGWV